MVNCLLELLFRLDVHGDTIRLDPGLDCAGVIVVLPLDLDLERTVPVGAWREFFTTSALFRSLAMNFAWYSESSLYSLSLLNTSSSLARSVYALWVLSTNLSPLLIRL